MAQFVQMTYRLARRRCIVDVRAGYSKPWTELATVYDRCGEGAFSCPCGQCFRQPMTEENETIGFLTLQHQGITLLAFRTVSRVSEQYRISFPLCCLLDSPNNQ